jgi:hypothetical protein
MNVRRDAVCFAALLVLTACPKKESDEDEKPKKKAAATAEATATATATAAPVATPTPLATEAPVPTPTGGGIKAELDNRSDGINGTTVSVPGAKATTVAAAGWKASKQGDVQVHAAPDEKARIAATSVGAEGPQKKLEAAATAAGLSGCTFGTPENVTVGKDKLAGQAAEGTCQRGAGSAKAAYLATEGLLVLGSFDTPADNPNVYGAMRSVAKAAAGGGGGGLAACCAAIAANAANAPLAQKGAYLMAADACRSAAAGGATSFRPPLPVPIPGCN